MQRNTGYFPTESLEPSGNRLFSRSALNEGDLFRGSLEELTKTIAERNGTTPEAVRREMEAARNSAWDTDDSSARGRQKVLFPAGKPQLSEFLEVIAKEIKKA